MIDAVGVDAKRPHEGPAEKNSKKLSKDFKHRRFVPDLIEIVRSGLADPRQVLSHKERLMSAIDAYEAFDQRKEGWIKVELDLKRPSSGAA